MYEGQFFGTSDGEVTLHPSSRSPGKRLLDILGASLGLSLTALVLPFIALAIVVESPGPVFFVQERVGLGGRRFRMFKFRSMVPDAERLTHLVANQYADSRFFKSASDPRITRVGAFLRRTSLDELPQFWNVLVGEMSLVGTRPPLPREVDQYLPHHWQRLAVRPGITGLWQVSGRSGIHDFEQVVALDLEYQRRWSLAFDLAILKRTIAAVFAGRGAC